MLSAPVWFLAFLLVAGILFPNSSGGGLAFVAVIATKFAATRTFRFFRYKKEEVRRCGNCDHDLSRDMSGICPACHSCESCGYDLTGNVTGVCPECGIAPGGSDEDKLAHTLIMGITEAGFEVSIDHEDGTHVVTAVNRVTGASVAATGRDRYEAALELSSILQIEVSDAAPRSHQ